MGTGAEVDARSEDRRPAPSRSPKAREWDDEQSVGLPEAGGFGPISGLRTTAALCLQLLFPFPFPFLPPPPPCRLSAPPRGRGGGGAGGGSCQTDPLPNRGYSGGYSARETVSHTSEAVRLGRRGRTDCGTHVIRPRGSAGLLSCLRAEVPGPPASRALPAASASSC